MKFYLSILALLLLFAAPQDGGDAYQAYIEKYSDTAVEEMHRTGVPASITLAQGLIESGAGKSTLATKANNHFGIKCHRDWTGRTMHWDDDKPHECFRAYDSAEESFRDHSDFLRYYDRYKFLFDYPTTDYKAWANGLKAAGYATDPGYAGKLISMIERYGLDRFDNDDPEVIPPSPLFIEAPKKVEKKPQSVQTELVSVSFNRIYEINSVSFIRSIEGETYASIAREFGLSRRRLLIFNDIQSDCELLPGTVVFIDHKKDKAEKGLEKYIVGSEGESLRDISQRFAVRLSSIIKMNGFSADYVPQEGDTIRLR